MKFYRYFSICTVLLFVAGALAACSTDDVRDSDNSSEVREFPDSGSPDSEIEDTQGENNSSIDDVGGDEDTTIPDEDTSPDEDADENDVDEPVDPVGGCQEIADTTATFEPPASSAAYFGQIAHIDETLWVTYIAVTDMGGEDVEKVFLARYGCDGQLIDGPTMIGQDEAVRDLHSVIAADDETVYIVWVADEADGQRVMGRSFDVDGTPRQDEPFNIEVQLKDGGTIGTIWKPDLAVRNDGNAVVIVEGLTVVNPRVIMQSFDDEGVAVGNGFYVYNSDDHGGQQEPAVAVMDDGDIHFAYLGGEFGEGRVYHGAVAPDADQVSSPPSPAQPTDTTSYSVASSKRTIDGFTWLVYPAGATVSNQIAVRDATQSGPTSVSSTSISGRLSLHANVAASPDGGAVAWMSYANSSTQRRVHFQGFDASSDGSITAMGNRVDQHDQDDAVWPYGPSITWLFDDVYAAVWTERDGNDELFVTGRIIELP